MLSKLTYAQSVPTTRLQLGTPVDADSDTMIPSCGSLPTVDGGGRDVGGPSRSLSCGMFLPPLTSPTSTHTLLQPTPTRLIVPDITVGDEKQEEGIGETMFKMNWKGRYIPPPLTAECYKPITIQDFFWDKDAHSLTKPLRDAPSSIHQLKPMASLSIMSLARAGEESEGGSGRRGRQVYPQTGEDKVGIGAPPTGVSGFLVDEEERSKQRLTMVTAALSRHLSPCPSHIEAINTLQGMCGMEEKTKLAQVLSRLKKAEHRKTSVRDLDKFAHTQGHGLFLKALKKDAYITLPLPLKITIVRECIPPLENVLKKYTNKMAKGEAFVLEAADFIKQQQDFIHNYDKLNRSSAKSTLGLPGTLSMVFKKPSRETSRYHI